MNAPKLDAQQVEIVGRNLLITHLLAGGIEVARPERDRGVDLIAYLDHEEGAFHARPIQLKAGSKASFSVSKKYAKKAGLIMVHIWNAADPRLAEIYALTYSDAVAIATEQGWTKTSSWTDKGHYTTSNPSSSLREALLRHRMEPEDWMALIKG